MPSSRNPAPTQLLESSDHSGRSREHFRKTDESGPPTPAQSSLLDNNLIGHTVAGGKVISHGGASPPIPSPRKYYIQILNAELPTSFPRSSDVRPQLKPMTAIRNSAEVHLRRISQGVPRDPQRVLTAAFTTIDYLDCIKNLARWRIDPQAYINGLDQVGSRLSVLASDPLTPFLRQILDTLSPELGIYKRCLRALGEVCGIYGLLPASHFLPPGLTTVHKRPFASGSFADLWKARSMDNQVFAVKRIRIYEVDNLSDVNKVLQPCCLVPTRISHRKTVPRNTAKRLSSAGE